MTNQNSTGNEPGFSTEAVEEARRIKEYLATQGNEEVARKQTAWLMNPTEIKYGESETPEADAHMARADAMRAIVKQLLDAKDLAHKEEVGRLLNEHSKQQIANTELSDEVEKLQGEVGALTKNLNEMGWAAKWRTSRDEQIIKLSSDLKMAVEALQEIADGTSLPVDDSNPACEMSETARAVLSKLSVKE